MLSLLWVKVSEFALSIFSKIWGYAVLAGGALLTFLYLRGKYREEGRAEIRKKVKDKTDEVQKKWDEIDRKPSNPSDFDRKLDSL